MKLLLEEDVKPRKRGKKENICKDILSLLDHTTKNLTSKAKLKAARETFFLFFRLFCFVLQTHLPLDKERKERKEKKPRKRQSVTFGLDTGQERERMRERMREREKRREKRREREGERETKEERERERKGE